MYRRDLDKDFLTAAQRNRPASSSKTDRAAKESGERYEKFLTFLDIFNTIDTKSAIMLFFVIPICLGYLIGLFFALPHRRNSKFRKRAVRKRFVTEGRLTKQTEFEATYQYRIGGNLHTAEINICRSAPKEIPGKVKIYYSDPYGKEIMVEEFAQDTAAGDTAIFLAYALVPLGLYFLLRYLLF